MDARGFSYDLHTTVVASPSPAIRAFLTEAERFEVQRRFREQRESRQFLGTAVALVASIGVGSLHVAVGWFITQ